ncbi:hypothetical protein [Amycolatopsis sp. CA-126428]|uniref:hypothetical protein n=1 Tax=Amycolatopsis sp. CA-126428 TaxID=2073158 RepID=UPI000CD03292|nr:hypothetical protein [Amycolatopsis sp. CA-126428]
MERTAVNPVTWSQALGFNQGEVVSGQTRTLYCSGQTSTDAEGKPRHEGDMAAARLGAAGVAPATTMLGVSRLAIPGQPAELEGTAVA